MYPDNGVPSQTPYYTVGYGGPKQIEDTHTTEWQGPLGAGPGYKPYNNYTPDPTESIMMIPNYRAMNGRDSLQGQVTDNEELAERSIQIPTANAKGYARINNQQCFDPFRYVPADNVDLSKFTASDLDTVCLLLSQAEVHKWKYISNRLSKLRSKKLSPEYAMSKFHQMYNLPFGSSDFLLASRYRGQLPNVSEGLLGSSLAYVVCKEGWRYSD